MNDSVRQLQPAVLWKNFADLNAIPRPSKKEQQVIAFMQDFGKRLGLPVITDEAGNVIIKKQASEGMEHLPAVVLQSHLDMVHQKNEGTDFDFEKQGIVMHVEGDWVKAAGTTLGADNGIGVAAIMSILESSDIPHPAIEALFTIDEETGMTGALALKGGLLEGSYLLNLDTEDDRELTIGCAGGVDVTASGTYQARSPRNTAAFRLSVKGLKGGHSGMDIREGRGNANKLMNRLLLTLVNDCKAEIASIDGGGLRNAVPRESVAVIVLPEEQIAAATLQVGNYRTLFQFEHLTTDPGLVVNFERTDMPANVMDEAFSTRLLKSIYACPNGIYRMSADMEGLVQTSNNLARVLVKSGEYVINCLSRSSVESEKADVRMAITAAFELCGATVCGTGDYPGWTPKPSGDIVTLMSSLYAGLFGEQPHVSAVHAGLECGILGRNYPGLQMISFGPNITGAHSPDEKVQISSVQKFWKFLLETLRSIPEA